MCECVLCVLCVVCEYVLCVCVFLCVRKVRGGEGLHIPNVTSQYIKGLAYWTGGTDDTHL